jgi:hypothetical protein
MQALQEKQAEAQKYKEMFEEGNPEYVGQTLDERMVHLKDLEYNKNTGLFVGNIRNMYLAFINLFLINYYYIYIYL